MWRVVALAWVTLGCDEVASGIADAEAAPDATSSDQGRPDIEAAPDAAVDAAPDAASDAAPPWLPPAVDYPDPDDLRPFRISETGLYRDVAAKALAPDLIAFEPLHGLWSDGSHKSRWLRLPAGAAIDGADPDAWQLPVGAMLFKEFRHPDGRRLETRLVARVDEGPRDYWMGAFVWDEAEGDALLVRDGAVDVRGTPHDVPEQKRCGTCHNGEPGRALGFTAVQLGPERVAALHADGVLSRAPDPPAVVPGEAPVQAALGYLHANCGHCHNPRGSARPDTDMNLRLSVTDTVPEETMAWRTTVGVELQYFMAAEGALRVTPGDPEASALVLRMRERGTRTAMPPIATEVVDDAGLALVRAWIAGL